MDVWSDVYEENRDHFEFNEDSEDEDEDYKCEECGVQVIAADIPENECRSIAYGSLSMAFCKPCYECNWAEHPENPANKDSDSVEDTDDEQENDEQKTYTTNALLYGKNHNLKYWQCIGTGTNGKVTLPNMIALKKSCTCHFCGYVEEDSKQSDQLVCGCNVCNLPLCDHCRATDGEDDVDDSICQACYDKSKEEEDE